MKKNKYNISHIKLLKLIKKGKLKENMVLIMKIMRLLEH